MQTREADDQFWWKSDAGDVHAKIHGYVKGLRRDQEYRTQNNLRFIRLYGNSAVQDLSVFGYSRTQGVEGRKNRLTLNIVQSMCDTVSAKISKNNPKPMFITSGGDWSTKRKAKKLNKFCEGQFHQTKIYEKAQRVFLDACIFGTGILKIYRKDAEIICERVFPEEITIDDVEAIHGEPRQLHQVKWINRQLLKAQWPDAAGYIDQISSGDGSYSESYRRDTDMILVTESWHLPSGPNTKDGKHVISIENKTLHEEEYTKDYFPFVFMKWTQSPLGFFGQGLAEQLQGIQFEINKILKTIQEAMHLGVIPKIFIEEGSAVVTAHLNNKVGTVIKYRGKPPTTGQLLSIPRELFEQLEWLYNRAYEVSGVSQLSAQSKKPAGLDSGKALREFNDIESERFVLVGQSWERFFLESARLMIDLAREISVDKEAKDYEVKIKGKRFFESIKWSDIDLEEDQYIMQVFPTSGLASTPSGRFQQIQEFLQAGFITPERAKKLLDMPDIESDTDLDVAALDDIEATLERIVDTAKYEPPEPYQNLKLGSSMFKQAYLKHKNDGAPEEVLELLRNWVVNAEAMLQQAQQPPAAPGAPPAQAPVDPAMAAAGQAAQPIATPAAPPVSDLLPVA